jgi:ribonucleoside-diphosphate reductase alpha chain
MSFEDRLELGLASFEDMPSIEQQSALPVDELSTVKSEVDSAVESINQNNLEPAQPTQQSFTAVESQQAADGIDHAAPLCSNCGNITQRAGSCYICTSCGTTSGCS